MSERSSLAMSLLLLGSCCIVCNAQDVNTVTVTAEEILKRKDALEGPLFVLAFNTRGLVRPEGALIISIDEPWRGNPGFLLSGVALEKRGRAGFDSVKRILAEVAPGTIVVFHNYRHTGDGSEPLGQFLFPEPSKVPFLYEDLTEVVIAKKLVVILNDGFGAKAPVPNEAGQRPEEGQRPAPPSGQPPSSRSQ